MFLLVLEALKIVGAARGSEISNVKTATGLLLKKKRIQCVFKPYYHAKLSIPGFHQNTQTACLVKQLDYICEETDAHGNFTKSTTSCIINW